MRLIDADKAERDIEELRKSDWFNAPYLTRERKLGLSEAFDMIQGVCIKHAPTVDAIPIEWIFDWENRYMNALPPEFQGETVIELFMEDWRKEQEKENGG